MRAPRTAEEEEFALQMAIAESKSQAGSTSGNCIPATPRYPNRPPPSAPAYPPVPSLSHPLFPPAVTPHAGGTLYPPSHTSSYSATTSNHHPNYGLSSYPHIPAAASGTSSHQHCAARRDNQAAQAAAARVRAREIEEADARLAQQLVDQEASIADRERGEQRRYAREVAARAQALQREEEDARLARQLAEQDARAATAAAEEQRRQAAAGAAAAAASAKVNTRQREDEDARLARQLAEEDARAAADAQQKQQERARAQQLEDQDARLARQLAEQEHLPGQQQPPQGPPSAPLHTHPPPSPQSTLQRIMDPFNNLMDGFWGALNRPPPQRQPLQPPPSSTIGGGTSTPRQARPGQPPQQQPQFPLPGQLFNSPTRCAGCGMPFGLSYVTAMERNWHPQCFTCGHCGGSLGQGGTLQFVIKDGLPYHSGCHRQCFHPCCYVCKDLIPETGRGKIEYQVQPFWQHKYCPRHTSDGTPKCCACQQMQPKDEEFATLSDGRAICLGCVSSIVVDTKDCQPLYDEILAFFRSMGMPHPERAPMILVDRHTLNEYSGREGKDTGSGPATHVQGLCLATVYASVPSIVRTPGSLLGVSSISTPIVNRRCNVSAVLVLYGLPRLLTGCILAHELMHAWLRMKNITGLNLKVEEGLCQLMAYVWLDRQHGKLSKDALQQRYASYFSYQIRTDVSDVYGNGFRDAYEAFEMRGLTAVINDVLSRGRFA